MLTLDVSNKDFPQLQLSDNVSAALMLMDEYELQHLPVVKDEKFAGLISKNDLLDNDETATLGDIEHEFIHASVSYQNHFLSALKLASELNLSLIPVTNESKDLMGCIAQKQLIQQLSRLLNVEEPGAIIVTEVEKHRFSFGELSRLIETNNAYITQLNTYKDEVSGLLIVTIKINKTEISDIISTLQRYEYAVKYYFGEELYENELKENYDMLMTYLRI